MFKNQSAVQLAAALFASGCFALALGARADAGAYSMEKKADKSDAACESAKLSAWFDRQRQLTDGETDVFQKIPTPRECLVKGGENAANESAPAKELATAKAPQRSTSWDFRGLNGR